MNVLGLLSGTLCMIDSLAPSKKWLLTLHPSVGDSSSEDMTRAAVPFFRPYMLFYRLQEVLPGAQPTLLVLWLVGRQGVLISGVLRVLLQPDSATLFLNGAHWNTAANVFLRPPVTWVALTQAARFRGSMLVLEVQASKE